MSYILMDPHYESKFKEIEKRIRCLQSGGTIDSLRNIGANTQQQIGASYVSLKNLAETYEKDEKLAELLWRQQKREEQIMACFLLPAETNKEKITQLMKTCLNHEIAGYLGSVFLVKAPDIATIVTEWIHTGEAVLQTAALTAAARHRILNQEKNQISQALFEQIVNQDYPDPYVQMVAQRYRFNN